MSATPGPDFILDIKRAEADFIDDAIFNVCKGQSYKPPMLGTYIKNKADLDRSSGDAADRTAVASNNFSEVEQSAALMKGVYEAARIRRDLNIGRLTRMDRFLSAYSLLGNQHGNLEYDIEVANGKRE